MKRWLLLILSAAAFPASLLAQKTHLDIMVPDRADTDLVGPVKSVELKLWQNVSGEYTTEKREFDRVGNLLKITETDEEGTLAETTTFFYDENGCYNRMLYENEEKGYKNDWEVILNPDTKEIALREKANGRIGVESYSPDGYITSYRLVDKDKKPLLAFEYKRDANHRRIKFTRIEGRKPAYTYYFKWADNGFIDMERQHYYQEKAERLHTYEYLVTDDYGNWTQRIMVRYDITGRKNEKVYEQTVLRKIEYFEDEAPAETGTAAASEAGSEPKAAAGEEPATNETINGTSDE